MIIFDAHVHIGNWNYEWYSDVNIYTKRDGDHSYKNAFRDDYPDKAILMPTDQKDNKSVLKEVELFPSKAFFFAWVDPFDDNIEAFLDENINDISGLKFHSALDRVEDGITHLAYRYFLDYANKHKLPILVHCGRWQETASYKYPLEIAEKYPDLKIICAHLGGDREDLKILAPRAVKERGLKNVWFDISATREWWTIGMAIDEIGADRIIFGSDYPVMHPTMSVASVKALMLDTETEEKIFYKNIMVVLGT